MMPIDPFFTSSGGGDYDGVERRGKAAAQAKAIQFHIHVEVMKKKGREKAVRKLQHHPGVKQAHRLHNIMATNMTQVLGGPSLTGFKKPGRKWTQIRTSHNP